MLGWSTCLEVLVGCSTTLSQRILWGASEASEQPEADVLVAENVKLKSHITDQANDVAV